MDTVNHNGLRTVLVCFTFVHDFCYSASNTCCSGGYCRLIR